MGRADKLLREKCMLVMGRPKTNSAGVVLNVKCPPRLAARVVIGSGNIGRLGLAEEGRLLGLGSRASLSLFLVYGCTHPHPVSYWQAHREASSLFPPPRCSASLQSQASTNCGFNPHEPKQSFPPWSCRSWVFTQLCKSNKYKMLAKQIICTV